MLKKVPKQESFIVCEDIRQEAGNKLTLCGVYSNGIVFQLEGPEKESFIISSLAFYSTYNEAEEECDLQIHIKSPSGKTIFESPTSKIPKTPNSPIIIAFKMQNFEFKELGTQSIIFNFDKKRITNTFDVRAEPRN